MWCCKLVRDRKSSLIEGSGSSGDLWGTASYQIMRRLGLSTWLPDISQYQNRLHNYP